MNLITWLVVGSLIGGVARMIMKPEVQQGAIQNVIVGIVGSMIGGWFITPLLGTATVNQNDTSTRGLVASSIGAVILLAIVHTIWRGRAR